MKSLTERAAKALTNARQRCTNKNNPDYHNYGALGIEVRFKTTAELLAEIGFPKPGQSLDRIDPNGHYEIGNVRWASKAVQSANKKMSSLNHHLSDGALINAAKDAVALQDERKLSTIAWLKMRYAHHRGFLYANEVEMLARLKLPGVLQANFDVNTIADMANPAPGFIHLPALTLPGARVRIHMMPKDTPANETYLNVRGRWAGLENLESEWNINDSVMERAIDVVADGLGLVLFGKATPDRLLGGWIDGTCLALAGRLPIHTGRTAAFFPMLQAVRIMEELGSEWNWGSSVHPILDDYVVIIPDFVLDCGPWGDLPPAMVGRVSQLILWRADRGLKTILGAPNAAKIPWSVRNLVLGQFDTLKMPTRPPLEMQPLQFASANWKVPEHTWSLDMLKNNKDTAHLFESYD